VRVPDTNDFAAGRFETDAIDSCRGRNENLI